MSQAVNGAAIPVRLRGVCKTYGSGATAIRAVSNLDLDVHAAEVLALLGPNGAGKTTTVEMCEGFVRPDAGSIEVLGLNPIAENARLRARIGVMLQGGGGYPAARAGELLKLVASYAADWLNLLARWLHVIAAIAWIGSSFYFIALDNHLRPPAEARDAARGVGGETWEIHGGGF